MSGRCTALRCHSPSSAPLAAQSALSVRPSVCALLCSALPELCRPRVVTIPDAPPSTNGSTFCQSVFGFLTAGLATTTDMGRRGRGGSSGDEKSGGQAKGKGKGENRPKKKKIKAERADKGQADHKQTNQFNEQMSGPIRRTHPVGNRPAQRRVMQPAITRHWRGPLSRGLPWRAVKSSGCSLAALCLLQSVGVGFQTAGRMVAHLCGRLVGWPLAAGSSSRATGSLAIAGSLTPLDSTAPTLQLRAHTAGLCCAEARYLAPSALVLRRCRCCCCCPSDLVSALCLSRPSARSAPPAARAATHMLAR